MPITENDSARERALAWLMSPFNEIARLNHAMQEQGRAKDVMAERVSILMELLNRANHRLAENGCQPVVVPPLDYDTLKTRFEWGKKS